MQKDLVCGTSVLEENPRFFSDYGGRVYPFCSTECKRKFDDHPDYFIHENAKRALGLTAEKE
ncbi:MAG: YHS domain-containing protein [Bryobacteraceae bacterium]